MNTEKKVMAQKPKKNIIIIMNVFLVILIVFMLLYFYCLNWYDNHCIYDSMSKTVINAPNQKEDVIPMCKKLDKYFSFTRNEIW